MRKKLTTEQRICAHTIVNPETECWECDYSQDGDGYPKTWIDGRTYKVSRVAFGLFREDPSDKCICHECDNPKCWNPFHLFSGTQQDNTADRHTKGRDARGDRHGSRTFPGCLPKGDNHYCRTHPEKILRGKEHGSSKLTEEEVQYIRMWAFEGFSQAKIAKAFGIMQHHVGRVVRREAWKHLPEFSIWKEQQANEHNS